MASKPTPEPAEASANLITIERVEMRFDGMPMQMEADGNGART